MNTVAYSAGRVCYPTLRDAQFGQLREDFGGWPRDAWWVGKRTLADWAPGPASVTLRQGAVTVFYGGVTA